MMYLRHGMGTGGGVRLGTRASYEPDLTPEERGTTLPSTYPEV